MFCNYRRQKDFIDMEMASKFFKVGTTRKRRYVNNKTRRKCNVSKTILT
jgi:hypothetical protein